MRTIETAALSLAGVFFCATAGLAAAKYVCPKYNEYFVLRCGYSDVSYPEACRADLVRCDGATREQFRDKTFVCAGDTKGNVRYCQYSPFSLEDACNNPEQPCAALPLLP